MNASGVPARASPFCTLFPCRVLAVMAQAAALKIPQLPSAAFPEMVQFVAVNVPSLTMPPRMPPQVLGKQAFASAVCARTVQSVSVGVSSLAMPPLGHGVFSTSFPSPSRTNR